MRSSRNSLHFFGALSTDEFKQFAAQSGVSCLSPQADCHPALCLLAIPGPRALMGIGRNPWEVRAGGASLGDDHALQCPEDIPLRNCLLSITWVPSSTPRAGDTGMSCGGEATEGPAVQHRRPCPSQHGRADAAQTHSGEGDQPWGGDGGRAGLTCWRPGTPQKAFRSGSLLRACHPGSERSHQSGMPLPRAPNVPLITSHVYEGVAAYPGEEGWRNQAPSLGLNLPLL